MLKYTAMEQLQCGWAGSKFGGRPESTSIRWLQQGAAAHSLKLAVPINKPLTTKGLQFAFETEEIVWF